MKNKHHIRLVKLIIILTFSFLIIAGFGMLWGCRYINQNLLTANQNTAEDVALLVENNFHITDEEVAYMKSLTFNEMEVDPINQRLMDVGDGVQLHAEITNVYVLAPLSESEIKYTTDKETAEFFGYDENEPLDGIWLCNGTIDDEGKFVVAQREDVYRYTKLTSRQKSAMQEEKGYAEYSQDAWGSFITGYAPLRTEEGKFVGLLGIDMDPDKYQESAHNMILTLIIAIALVAIATVGLFLIYYYKYIKAKEGQLYFDFYSRMSHDMRTPMNGILGMALLSRDEDNVDVLHRNFEQVEESGQYMLGLINDTLDVQKLEAGKLRLDPKVRSCKNIFESLRNMMQIAANKKGIQLEILNQNLNLDSYVRVDELRLQQIFMNIVSNAIKFTPEGGKVICSMETIEINDNIWKGKFQISDTGIGMSKKFIEEHLFKPFEQEANSVTTQYGGSGLGLSIVKRLVEMMGGRIEVISTLGKGTTFTIYMDCEVVSKQDAQAELDEREDMFEISHHELMGKRILLVEDQKLNAEIALRFLEKYGAGVTIANNGKEAVDLFENSDINFYHLILMDIRMPVMDGLSATRIIRSLIREDAKTVPIIAMTANAYDDDIKNCIKAGMNDHISKPINPKVMYQTIAKTFL